MTCLVLVLLRAIHTLRVDFFFGISGAAMCANLLVSMAQRRSTARLTHLALHNLTLCPDDPQVAAIQAQSNLLVT